MLRKTLSLLLLLPLVIVLSGCASLKLPGTQSSTTTNQNQAGQASNFTNQPVESKLAIGTLKLEGTANAVTAEQAKTLLPLWKAVKSLSASSTASTDEINALYKQIQEAMTAGQIQAIKDMSLTPEDTQALMKQYNIQAPQRPAFQGTPGAQGTPRARNSSGGNSNSGGFPAGGPDGGGFPGGGMPPDGGAGFPSGNAGGNSGQPNAQRTPQAGQPRGVRGGGMNTLFIDPLITLLQDRAG